MTPYSLYARHGGFLVICTKTLPDREQHSQFWRTNVGSERVSYWAKDTAHKRRFGKNQMWRVSHQTNLLLEKWFNFTSEKKVPSSLLLLSSQNRSSRWNNLIFSTGSTIGYRCPVSSFPTPKGHAANVWKEEGTEINKRDMPLLSLQTVNQVVTLSGWWFQGHWWLRRWVS